MSESILTRISTLLITLRQQAPLIHCITNYVSMDFIANSLLALGVSPVMAHAEEEVEELVGLARALYINIGTLSSSWVRNMHKATTRARDLSKPWILDPVGCGATAYRTQATCQLIQNAPTVIRGNASEIMAILGASAPKGVDTVNTVMESEDTARRLARQHKAIVVVSGPMDFVTDGQKSLWIQNGHPLMTQVTAMGCVQSSIISAFVSLNSDPFTAALAGTLVTSLCGELASKVASAPASFYVVFLDTLYKLSPDDIMQQGRITYDMPA